jgi:hypothetical protein
MSLAKLVALSLAVSKGSAIPSTSAKKGKHFFKEMDKQMANAKLKKNGEIRDAINVLKRFRNNANKTKSNKTKSNQSKRTKSKQSKTKQTKKSI